MERLRLFSAAVSVCLCAFMIISTAAASAGVIYSHELDPNRPMLIGGDGSPVYVRGGGSFVGAGGEVADFGDYSGFAFIDTAEDGETPYPILKSSFNVGELVCTLTQFADRVTADGTEVTAVYSSLDVKNKSGDIAPFPAVSDTLVALTDAPAIIKKGESANCKYVAVVSPDADASDEALTAAGTYEERLSHMKAFWDEYCAEHGCFTPSGDVYDDYFADVVRDAVLSEPSALSVYDGRITTADGNMSPFSVWLLSRRGAAQEDYTASYDLAAKIDDLVSHITKFDCGYADDVYLYSSAGEPTAEGCFEAMSELGACLSLAADFGITDVSAAEEAYKRLVYGTETVFLHTVGYVDGAWELCSAENTDELSFSLDPQTTAAALVSWYLRSSAMGCFDSGRLSYTAREAFKYADRFTDPADRALAIIQPCADGGVCIGRGLCASWAARGISANGFDGNGEKVSITVLSEGKNVTVKIDRDGTSPISVTAPFFRDNIENASCPFDSESGTLTPDVSGGEITVTLKRGADELSEEYGARAELETALFEAAKKSTDGCTDISGREFEAARDSALTARNAGVPAAQMAEAAETLSQCSARLSNIISGYTYALFDGETATMSAQDETLIQKFLLPKNGRVGEICVEGGFEKSSVARVYAVVDDGYSLGEIIAEASAKLDDGKAYFEFDFDAESNKSYALELTGADCKYASAKSGAELYSVLEDGTVKIHDGAALAAMITVTRCDRTELDALYETYQSSDVSRYTRESVKNLQSALQTAADLLRTPDAGAEECEEALWNLKLAFSSLTTYASDMRVTAASPALYVLIGVTILLLLGSLATASAAGHRKKRNSEKK